MTPQERKLVDELFERLERLENAPRDPDAVAVMNDGLQRAPNALYALVQTALVQDEALKRADVRIRELEAELGVDQPQQQQQGGFLDSMRDALLGKREEPRGSVPPVPPGSVPGVPPSAPSGPWRNTTGRQDQYAQESGYGGPPPGGQPGGYGQPGYAQAAPGSSGGSFLGTAAATAAGVVGGALLANSFRHMFGGGSGQSHAAYDQSGGGSPWSGGGGNLSNTDLARDAGVGDIGRGGGSRNAAYDDQGGSGGSDRAGLFDTAQNDTDHDDNDDDDGGYDDGGDTDTA